MFTGPPLFSDTVQTLQQMTKLSFNSYSAKEIKRDPVSLLLETQLYGIEQIRRC